MRNLRANANAVTQQECTCCHVYHNPGICAQCQVAGCGGNKKGEKCRLSGHILSTMAMSEFQLRQRVLDLEKQLALQVEETRKLERELESKRTAA
jgi:hypothetical protein